ncbi:catabolite control protein A, partial [Enterococcus faecalis]|nr:catabolite control protein A [Enterococcus faecalis]
QHLYDSGAVSMRLLNELMNKDEIEEKTVVLPYGMDQKGSTK